MSCQSCCINNNKPIYSSNKRSDKSNVIHEIPVRDRSNSVRNFKTQPNFAAPNDLPKQDGTWELQYCKWSGWTWVKRINKDVTIQERKPLGFEHPQSKSKTRVTAPASHEVLLLNHERPKKYIRNKKKKCCGCFGKKESTKIQSFTSTRSGSLPVQNSIFLPPVPSVPAPQTVLIDKETQSRCKKTDVKRCCRCCCCCCCCCSSPHFCNTSTDDFCEDFENNQECSTSVGTQTKIDMKEKATKISKTCINKLRNETMITSKCCKQPIYHCCCCKHRCCLCLKNRKSSNGQNQSFCNDSYVNCCLTKDKNKLVSSDCSKNKFSNFFLSNKSLDLFLKNNINLSRLMTDKGFENSNKNTYQFLESNAFQHEKSFRPATGNLEHKNVLTAVCDAILSNHKLNDATNLSRKMNFLANDKSSDDFNSGHSVLDFSDLSLTKSGAVNQHCEIGVQVDDVTKKSGKSGNLLKSYNRLPHRLHLLKKNLYYMKKKHKKKVLLAEPTVAANSETYFLPTGMKTESTQGSTTISTINKLLESIKLLSNTSAEETVSQSRLQEDKTAIHLLDATSPPFTDCDSASARNSKIN